MADHQTRSQDRGFVPVSTLMLFPGASGRFKVFIRQAGRHVLYASENETFTRDHLARLKQNGMEEVYLLSADAERFESYVRRNLADHLLNETVPLEDRARVFQTTARSLVAGIYDRRLPARLVRRAQFARIKEFVEKSLAFVAKAGALRQIASLMAHDHASYDHALQVFVYGTSLLGAYGLPEQEMVHAGAGAIMHDLGMLGISAAILDKPGALTREERLIVHTHPAKGVAMCSGLALPQTTLQCILFHHERADGSGYPAGLGSPEIPLQALATGLVDVYAAMTSPRPYAPAFSPFEALREMRDMKRAFDADMLKRFVMVLSGAEII